MEIKTNLQLLQELEPELKKKAIANIIQQKGTKRLFLREYRKSSQAINGLFRWSISPEKYPFWSKIYNDLKDSNK